MKQANNCWVLSLRILFQFLLIKLRIIIFGQAHLHSRTNSRALRTEYCIVDIVAFSTTARRDYMGRGHPVHRIIHHTRSDPLQ